MHPLNEMGLYKKTVYDNDFSKSSNRLEPLKIQGSLSTAKKTFTQLSIKN